MMSIQIPTQFSSWFKQDVMVMRGIRGRACLYTLSDFEKLNAKIDENIRKYSLTYPQFKEFLMAGTHQCHIQSDGKIDLPDILLKWINESTGTLEVTQGTYGLGIGKRRKEECSCDDITCAKCLASNCKDDECAIHTQKRKKEYLQNRSTVVKPE